MPFSSSSLTSVASEKRGGGWVNFCSGFSSRSASSSPFASGGSTLDYNGLLNPTYNLQGSDYYNVGDAFGALDGSITDLYSRVFSSTFALISPAFFLAQFQPSAFQR